MSEFRMLADILQMHKDAEKMKRQSQTLYDELGGAVIYILEYAEKNNILLPNRKALLDMVNRIHYRIDVVNDSSPESYRQDDPDSNHRRVNRTVLGVLYR